MWFMEEPSQLPVNQIARSLTYIMEKPHSGVVCDRKRFFAETPKLKTVPGKMPKMAVSAETWLFRQKFSSFCKLSSSGWFSRVPWTLYLIKELVPKETFSAKTVNFRPKQPFSAENSLTAERWKCFGRKFTEISAVSPFDRTLNQGWMTVWECYCNA